ncbi:AAA family ATPase [Novosphingobium humi]|uniref:AAA family ATPase n=1 Tax=Novosphingobium humi TaxID=2282397 RepID=A0ABY7TWY3_9SPHN|nr:AAA family ATPase [Novosphingobium humi]WCT76329.1 AAA family ATPase [Novosphingobium humi]
MNAVIPILAFDSPLTREQAALADMESAYCADDMPPAERIEYIRQCIDEIRKARPEFPCPALTVALARCGGQAPISTGGNGSVGLLPVVNLNSFDGEPPVRRSIWGDWFPVRQTTMLTGMGGVGKSLLTLDLLASIALGLPFLGMETERARCLFVTCEDDVDELWRRLASFCRAHGVRMADLDGWLSLVSLAGETGTELARYADNGGLVTTERWQQLVTTNERLGIRVVAYDNATDAFAGDHNAIHEVAAFVNLLTGEAQRIDGAFLLLHHPNKAGADWLGSVAWHNKVRSRWMIEGSPEGADPNARTIANPKSNYGPQGGRITFRWNEGAFVREADLPGDMRAKLAETTAAAGANQLFLACLRECTRREQAVSASPSPTYAPKMFAEMPEAKGLDAKALAKAMNRLLTLGLIETGELSWLARDRHRVRGLRETAGNCGERCDERAADTCGERGERSTGMTQVIDNTAAYEGRNCGVRNSSPTERKGEAPKGSPSPSYRWEPSEDDWLSDEGGDA